jgi:hypothetical protein
LGGAALTRHAGIFSCRILWRRSSLEIIFPTALRVALKPLVHRDHFFCALRSPRRDWRAGNSIIAPVHPPGHNVLDEKESRQKHDPKKPNEDSHIEELRL